MAGLDANVVLLMHFNGDDEGTTFTDSSASAHSFSADGTQAQTDTAIKKFGTASLLLDGSDYLTTATHADWEFGDGDFTIDVWVYPSNVAGDNAICSSGGLGGWCLYASTSFPGATGVGFASASPG